LISARFWTSNIEARPLNNAMKCFQSRRQPPSFRNQHVIKLGSREGLKRFRILGSNGAG